MKIIGISVVKNEGDFIECFIRMNAYVIDEFFIADDKSDDETLEIIGLLKQEHIKINTFEISDPTLRLEQQQSTIIANLLQSALKSGFDFAFLLDADELILTSRKDVERELESLRPREYGALPWKTFIPLKPDFPGAGNPIRDMFGPLIKELYPYTKAVIPSQLVNESTIAPGNHFLVPSPKSQPIAQRTLGFPLCHFPVRSAEQIIAKSLVMCHKASMKRNKIDGEAGQHFMIREKLKKNNYTLSFSDIQNIAYNYIDQAERLFSSALLGSYNGLFVPDVQLRHTKNVARAIGRLDGFLEELCAEYRRSNSTSRHIRNLV